MARRTLIVRRNGALPHPRDAQRLLERLVAQPGVESVRIEAMPLCVVLRVAEECADESTLRAIVQQQRVELPSQRPAPLPPPRPRAPSMPPATRPSFAASAWVRP